MALPVPTKAFQSTASQGSYHVHDNPCSYLPLSHLFASDKPTFKTDCTDRSAPTDNMRPKLHDRYTCHQWLKG